MNGWLLVRIAGIVVGIATLLRVATNEGIVTYDPLFLAWMDRLRDLVELGFLTDVIHLGLQWGIDQFRSLGISVPYLQDAWRPAFVLNMLLLGVTARHSRAWVWFASAPIVALTGAVWTGMTEDYIFGVFLAVIAACYAAGASGAVPFVLFVSSLSAIPVVYLADSEILASGKLRFPTVAVTAVIAFAVYQLTVGMTETSRQGWRAMMLDRKINTGIDILFTMSGALIIASIFANPPIW